MVIVFRGLYSIWFLIVALSFLFIGFFVFLIGSLLPQKKAAHIFHLWNSIWSWFQCRLCFLPYKVHNAHLGRLKSPHIIVCNHRSFADAFLLYRTVRKPFMPLAKKELRKIPVLGFMVKAACVMVDRSSVTSREKSMEKMTAVLKAGTSIFIFPEGTRNRTEEPLKKFYAGAFNLALASGYPILPLVFKNTEKVMGPHHWAYRPAHLKAQILDPFDPNGYDLEKLMSEVKEAMLKALQNL